MKARRNAKITTLTNMMTYLSLPRNQFKRSRVQSHLGHQEEITLVSSPTRCSCTSCWWPGGESRWCGGRVSSTAAWSSTLASWTRLLHLAVSLNQGTLFQRWDAEYIWGLKIKVFKQVNRSSSKQTKMLSPSDLRLVHWSPATTVKKRHPIKPRFGTYVLGPKANWLQQ